MHRLAVAAGFERVVERALAEDVSGLEVLEVDSGSLVVRGRTLARSLATLPYLSVVLQQVARTRAGPLEAAMPALADLLRDHPFPEPMRRLGTFRLRTSDGGALVRVDPARRSRLEQAISQWSSLRPDPRGGGAEVWLIRRRGEADVSLGVRVDTPTQNKPAKGELKTDVAAALVRTTPLDASDVFLDPFAGSGALLRARARWNHRLIVGSDRDPAAAQALEPLGRKGVRVRTGAADATDRRALATLLDGHPFDVTVTDPPWGAFARGIDVDTLYAGAAAALRTVAAPAARVVVLTSLGDLARRSLGTAAFEVTDSFPVLVNGKKAEVVVACAPA